MDRHGPIRHLEDSRAEPATIDRRICRPVRLFNSLLHIHVRTSYPFCRQRGRGDFAVSADAATAHTQLPCQWMLPTGISRGK